MLVLSSFLILSAHCQGAWCKRIACLENPAWQCMRQAIHIADHPKCPPSSQEKLLDQFPDPSAKKKRLGTKPCDHPVGDQPLA